MIVVDVENSPPNLRGRLAVWMLEIRSGLYIGNFSKKVREMIWENIRTGIGEGNAVMAWREQNEAGFDFLTIGKNRRSPKDYQGLKMIRFESEKI